MRYLGDSGDMPISSQLLHTRGFIIWATFSPSSAGSINTQPKSLTTLNFCL